MFGSESSSPATPVALSVRPREVLDAHLAAARIDGNRLEPVEGERLIAIAAHAARPFLKNAFSACAV